MLPVLLLVVLCLCNAQGPLQSAGSVSYAPSLRLEQRGYQDAGNYYAASEWVENVPKIGLHDYGDSRTTPKTRVPFALNVSNPEIDDGKMKVIINSLEVPGTPEDRNSKISPMLSSAFSKAVVNDALSRKSLVKDRVTNLANHGSALKNDTDQLVDQLNLLYRNLAVDETDKEVTIENSYKYGISLILRFLFEFYRIFRKLSAHTAQSTFDMYSLSYDQAMVVLKEKKGYSPLDISAFIRRSLDIFKRIIYESVVIIQTKCKAVDPNWKCIIVYLANLLNETINCSNVWYHAFIHMLALESIGIRDSFVHKIGSLDRFRELIYFENIFDFIIEKITEYRNVGKVQLSAEAIFFTMLADLQENGLLDCIRLDYSYN